MESIFHGDTNDIIRTEDVGIKAERADNNGYDEDDEAQDVLGKRMFFKNVDLNRRIIIHNNYFNIPRTRFQ